MPNLGDTVTLIPAPLDGKPRRVQDGAGNFGRFLPAAGAERTFDVFWHDRLRAGDVQIARPPAPAPIPTPTPPTEG